MVPPPPRLPPLLILHYIFLVLCSIFLQVAIAISEEGAGSSTIAPEVQPVHIVAQFPPITEEPSINLDYNGTGEGALRFNHLVLDPQTGQLYAGAVNRLMQLDSELNLKELVITGKTHFFY